jgi:hypothetical protein
MQENARLGGLEVKVMGCILVLIAVAMPRLLMAAIFLLTGWFGRAFETALWPLLGWFFMPYTTLAYMAAMLNNDHKLEGGWIVLLIVAVFFDLSSSGMAGKHSRNRNQN